MEKVNFNEEIDQVLDNLMREQIGPHTCQFFEKVNGFMKPYGSGVFAKLGNIHFALTASHVTEQITEAKPLFFKTHRGYIPVSGDLRETKITNSNGIDLAYIKLDTRIVADLEAAYKFLPISKFRKHNLIDATQYCILGFPEVNQKVEDGVLKTGASAYFVRPFAQKVYDHYDLKTISHYILEFKGKGTDVTSGLPNKLNGSHYGLSGCGLWLILLEFDGKKYIANFRLIGIMTEFRKGKYNCLIGNRIDFLLDVVQKDHNISFNQTPLD